MVIFPSLYLSFHFYIHTPKKFNICTYLFNSTLAWEFSFFLYTEKDNKTTWIKDITSKNSYGSCSSESRMIDISYITIVHSNVLKQKDNNLIVTTRSITSFEIHNLLLMKLIISWELVLIITFRKFSRIGSIAKKSTLINKSQVETRDQGDKGMALAI